MNQHNEMRSSVEIASDTDGQTWLRGTETTDALRANVFGVWRDDDSEYDGRYHEAQPHSSFGIEVEVRHAFADFADTDDHAEVYLWQAYNWRLDENGLSCAEDKWSAGEYVVEADGIEGPLAIFSPLVAAAVRRIQRARETGENMMRVVEASGQ